MGISFLFYIAFCFSSFHSYFLDLLRQPFCFFFAFLFLGDGLDPCLLYNVMNLHPSETLSALVPYICFSLPLYNHKGRYPMSKVRSGGCEEIPHVQGKEQRLCFAGAAVKKYPTSKVRETQVRWQALRRGIRGQTD